jgi:hypothetical protein
MDRDEPSVGRNAWLQDELRTAKQRVPSLRDGVIETIEAATDYRTMNEAPSDESDPGWDDLDGFDWGEPF